MSLAAPSLLGIPEPTRTQRSVLAVGLCVLLALGAAGSGVLAARSRPATVHLHAEGLALGPGGTVLEVGADAALVPGSRVLAGMPDSLDLARQQEDWLAAGTVPQVPGLASDLIRTALLDLQMLSQASGVPVAGWTPAWRYVWPRDSAFAASALARTGHLADAERILDFLARVQPASGMFQARYLLDGSGAPDERGVQLDGTGWALWACAQVAAEVPADDRPAFVARHKSLIDRSTGAALATIDNRRTLPPPSADYWELAETRSTLATAAVLAAGLESAVWLYAAAGDDAREPAARSGVSALRRAITAGFGPDGYPRHLGGRAGSVDLGVSFLLPPFATAADPEVVQVWRRAAAAMARPAGGLAPGGAWRRDGVSWTNATATFAMTAAALGDRDAAYAWLSWLDRHRTATGSLPEKVLADGRPASVAPLTWTAAAVIIAADQLA
jgi:glucoamylase